MALSLAMMRSSTGDEVLYPDPAFLSIRLLRVAWAPKPFPFSGREKSISA